MEKMFSLLANHADVQDKPGAPDLNITRSEVRFDHVDFGYSEKRQILHDVSFEIPAGHKVAVVGHSGSGKSTLSRLLFRFYEVNGGRHSDRQQDIRDVTQKSLRAAIGIVPQDTVLFNDTIRLQHCLWPSWGRLKSRSFGAAQTAHIHTTSSHYAEWLRDDVGERGLKLSGGEKQRIAIARTVLKNPRFSSSMRLPQPSIQNRNRRFSKS